MTAGIEISDYDAVVSDIYDAALSPSHWEVALTGLVGRFGADQWESAMLLWERLTPPAGRFIGWTGVHAMARQGYLHSFAGSNDWSVRGHALPVGSVVHSDHLVDRALFRESPFYRDYLASFDFEVGLLALLDRHGDDHLCLCMPGPDNGAPDRLETATRLLLPHIQRAVRISRRIGEAELSSRSAKAALDAAPSAILMCDAAMRLTYANALGEALVRDGYLALRGAKLSLHDRRHQARLRSLADPATAQRCMAFALERDDAAPVTAMAIRMETDQAHDGHPDFAGSQLMIVAGRNHRAAVAHIDHLRDWFGLTPAEARLAATLAEGGSLEDFAATRGISPNAARFLLKGVFAKTGANPSAAIGGAAAIHAHTVARRSQRSGPARPHPVIRRRAPMLPNWVAPRRG